MVSFLWIVILKMSMCLFAKRAKRKKKWNVSLYRAYYILTTNSIRKKKKRELRWFAYKVKKKLRRGHYKCLPKCIVVIADRYRCHKHIQLSKEKKILHKCVKQYHISRIPNDANIFIWSFYVETSSCFSRDFFFLVIFVSFFRILFMSFVVSWSYKQVDTCCQYKIYR